MIPNKLAYFSQGATYRTNRTSNISNNTIAFVGDDMSIATQGKIFGVRGVYPGVCGDDQAALTTKVVTTSPLFPLDTNGRPLVGTTIAVHFAETDTSTAKPYLNVNGTGGYAIQYGAGTIASKASTSYTGYAGNYIYYWFDWDDSRETDKGRWVWLNRSTFQSNTDVEPGRLYGTAYKTGSVALYRNTLAGMTSGGYIESIVTSSSTGKTKTRNTHGFRLGQWYYNASTTATSVAANTNITSNILWLWYTSAYIDCQYSFNSGKTLTGHLPIYLVGTIGNDNLFYLDATWWTQTLPNTEDGKVYVDIGVAYDTYRFIFNGGMNAWEYKDGALRPYSYHQDISMKRDKLDGFLEWLDDGFGIDAMFNSDNFPRTEADARALTESEAAALAASDSVKCWTLSDSPGFMAEINVVPNSLLEYDHTWSLVASMSTGVVVWTFSIKKKSGENKYWFEQSRQTVVTSVDGTLATVATTGSYNDLTDKPNIPTVPNIGTLNTNNSTAQTVSSSESFSGTINLHKVSKTGSYNDLNNQPPIPSASTITPLMDGTAAIGSSSKYAKEDHVHPSDTSRVPTSRKINNKPLSSDITLNASDVGAIPTAISTTYANLVTTRTSSQLTAGAWYRITDYNCTTTQTDTQSAGHQFDILVQATSPNTLSEEAKAIRHEGDTYFANSNFEDWKIWYCLDNDTTRFVWADATNGKGVIYRMIDEHNNDCPYDFKNIQFKRYKITATTKTDTSLVGKYMAAATTMDGHTVDANDFVWCYTFNGYYASWYQEDEESGYIDYYNLGSVAVDMSNFDLSPFYDDNYYFSQRCGDNRMQPAFEDIRHWLNNIVIYGWVSDISTFPNNFKELYGDYIDEGVMSSCYSNTFGNSCYSNTFGNGCYFNTFGNDCFSNTFGNDFFSNMFGNNCRTNTFGYNCSSNTFGNGCYFNTFGNSCYSNTFGNGCYSDTFGNSCYSNTFGNGCNSNMFGNSCRTNTFGNGCYFNTFGNNCNFNTFGDDCDSNTFSKPYTQHVIVENGNRKITLTSTQTPTSSNPLRNITIAEGVNNTNTVKTISHNTLNDTFRTTYTTDVNGNIYAIAPAKYAEWDNKQSALVSGTDIKTINNQSLLGSGNLTASDIGAMEKVILHFEYDEQNDEVSFTDSGGYELTHAEVRSICNSGAYVFLFDDGAGLMLIPRELSNDSWTFTYGGGLYNLSVYLSWNLSNSCITCSSYNEDYGVPSSRTINSKELTNDITLTASDIGAITRFVVDFTLSGTTISNPNKTFSEIKAAYDAGNLVLARDDAGSLYYLLYCETTSCGFSCCDSSTLYDISVDSSNAWTYHETNISQLELDLSDKSQIIYMQKVNNVWKKVTYNNVTGAWLVDNTALTTGNTKNIYLDIDNNDLYYWNGSAFILLDEDNVQPDWNQNDSTKADYIKNKPTIPNSIKVGSVAGKLYRNNVAGSGNFTVTGNSGCIPNLTAGTFLVSIYAKSATQSYTFRFNFGSSVTYDLSTTNGEISDVRQITIPSNGTFSGLVLNGSVASGTILYVVMYNYLTPISTVGPAAVTNRYSDLDGTPTIPTVNNGTLTIKNHGVTVGTFTANQSGNTTADITTEVVTVSGTGSITQALDANKFYKFGSVSALTLTLNAAGSGLAIYAGKFTASANNISITLPSGTSITDSSVDIESGNTYEFSILDGVCIISDITIT